MSVQHRAFGTPARCAFDNDRCRGVTENSTGELRDNLGNLFATVVIWTCETHDNTIDELLSKLGCHVMRLDPENADDV